MTTPVDDPTRGTSEPGRYWTTTNLGEAAPDVLSPMCLSVWGEPAELGWRYSMYAFGVLTKKGVTPSQDVNDWGPAVFYGRVAMNVDVIRSLVVTIPGVNPNDVERDLAGSVRPDPPEVKGNLWRAPVIMTKAPLTLLRQRRRIRDLYADTYRWWETEVFLGGSSTLPIDRLDEALARFGKTFKQHTVTRFMFSGAQGAIVDAAAKAGDPLLATQLLSGVGGVFETRMADDLWRLGHDEVDEQSFLREWGYHGPNEGNPTATVWREDPRQIRAMATSMRDRESERAQLREKRAVAASAEAEQRLLAATPAARRGAMRWLLRRARSIVRTLQMGKASYLMAIDGVRRATRDFGAEQVAKGVLRESDDAFFLTAQECRRLADAGVPGVQELVDGRRRLRDEYRTLSLPVYFTGMPVPIARQVDDGSERGAVEFTGAASGGAAVEGRARVLLDVNDDIDLEDGDILVCRFTDPSWAPLMSLAEALVIDIGGSASHGAVVARELGIPFVIGCERGTSLLRDGDRILVDGEKNLVRVLIPAEHTSTSR